MQTLGTKRRVRVAGVLVVCLLGMAGWAKLNASDVVRPPNIVWVNNSAGGGTALYQTVKLEGAPSTGTQPTTLDTYGAVGICVSGCGVAAVSATASVAAWGNTSCVFDGATVAGDYIGLSAAADGNCTDKGAAYPASGQVLGRVLSTNVGAGTYPVILFGPDIEAGGGVPGGTGVSWLKYALVKIGIGVNGCTNALLTAVFAGAGLDDLTAGGTCSAVSGTTYTVIVDGLDTILANALNAGGADYVPLDTFTVDTGTTLATGRVDTVGALGTVTSYTLLTRGKGYAVAAGVATTATLGIGTGLTIDITTLNDTFKWQKNAGAFTENVVMTVPPQALMDGVTVAFAAIVGHTLADQWTITATDLGCWQVNGVLEGNADAALTQDVILGTLAARGHVTDYRIKVGVRCTGATTALSGLGTIGTNTLYRTQNYDIDQVVGNTAIATGPPTAGGSDTHGVTELVASLITTVNNIDQLVTGCAVDYWLLQGVLP